MGSDIEDYKKRLKELRKKRKERMYPQAKPKPKPKN